MKYCLLKLWRGIELLMICLACDFAGHFITASIITFQSIILTLPIASLAFGVGYFFATIERDNDEDTK